MKSVIVLIITIIAFNNTYSQLSFEENIIDEGVNNLNNPFSANLADIDNDGDLDVFSISYNDNKIIWYENLDGLGNYGPQKVISTEIIGSISLNASDIDGDGDLDLFVLNNSNVYKLGWLENLDGKGNFGSYKFIEILGDTNILSIGFVDFDNDGDIDVFYSQDFYTYSVSKIEHLDGLGNFSSPQTIFSGSDRSLYDATVADIDGDNDLDIILAKNGRIEWYENLGEFDDFGTPNLITTFSYLTQNRLKISDINGDGNLDIIVVDSRNETTSWFENLDGLGSFSQEKLISNNSGSSVSAADMDEDGDIDIIFNSPDGTRLNWYRNIDGQGSFIGPYNIITNMSSSRSLSVKDIDGDNDNDIIVVDNIQNKISWYKKEGFLRINEIDNLDFIIAPNPTNNDVYIHSKEEIISVAVYNSLGQLLFNTKGPKINLSNLNSGIYYVKMESENNKFGIQKIIKR